MKLGLNIYLDSKLISISVIELGNDELVNMFGDILKYNDFDKLVKSEPDSEKEVLIKNISKVQIRFFNLTGIDIDE
ncbi:hypothetical protein [Acinetobacter phage BUCT628]|uniref:Uncharacterized protein n=1 Tax=Thermovibrio guaymasensis TaxID=240167 RepID=A0A420W5C8_9BACT|nr:hypothetical protein [Thermovibrio guaymasensis]QYC51398.1 hypothetical protein [Acinetobacter phage BUCT628]RKQ59883.1 hypothetical protein C7457_1668 [Thermovibrio guaymasensis]